MINQERVNQVALLALQQLMESEGNLKLMPKEVKRSIANQAKNLGIQPWEAAALAKVIFTNAFEKVLVELDSIKDPSDEKK